MPTLSFTCTARRLLLPVALFMGALAGAQSTVQYPDAYLSATIAAGKSYTPEQVKRIGDLGKLWGMLHFFNPRMHTGQVITDSLVMSAAAIVINDPSAVGFRRAVHALLAQLQDGGTSMEETGAIKTALLFTRGSKLPVVHPLPDSNLYIAFPTLAANNMNDPSDVRGLSPQELASAKGIIFDIRNAGKSPASGNYTFLFDVMPLLRQVIAGSKPLPAIYERRVYHNGFVSQTSSTPNIYSSGWQVSVSGNYSNKSGTPLGKPVVFIYNQNTDIEIIQQLSSLRAAGLCRLLYEGTPNSYPNGNTERVNLADGISVNVRINEYLLPGNQPLPPPDLIVDRISDTAINGSFIRQASALLTAPVSDGVRSPVSPADFVLPRPGRYADTLVPSAERRLFGLYNFWNSFRYFSPYQQTLDHDWDPVLYRYVPVFLNAGDSLSYMLAVRSLASETQDCHGFVNSSLPATPARKFYGAWPPVQLGFIDHKVYIVELAKDSSQDLRSLEPGDEVTHLDNVPVSVMKEKWRHYIPTSNESTYERDVANYLPTGPLNSTLKLTVRRGGNSFIVELKRNGRWPLGKGIMSFDRQHPVTELLPGNVGYIHMGKLRQDMVDSTMKALMNTQAIIFDIRNYPQGTAWSIVPLLTDTPKKAVLFDKPFVNYDYLRGGEDQSTLKSYFTAMPGRSPVYKGKVIILCNETTQSQAEYSIMLFQGARPCTVIGSQTAGADGNVTEVALPGGYSITFSGLGIYYPDGTPTQRSGIKVDIPVKPTLAGLKAGKDEVLERALQFIGSGR